MNPLQDTSVKRWLKSAQRARGRARTAYARAARAATPQLAVRFEREAHVQLRSAACFANAARAAVETAELEYVLAKRLAARAAFARGYSR